MKKVLAVSGGVDSVVMLDILAKKWPREELVVAHFDHGTRESSREDAEFVRELAEKYNVEFVTERAELGEEAPEAAAREARYRFLRKVAVELGDAGIYTAHHLDDLVETVTINLLRGTGWRGLAALNAEGVRRPFLELELVDSAPLDKKDLLVYAAENGLCFREDPTNNSDKYLRNRVREAMVGAGNEELKNKIFELWLRQKKVAVGLEDSLAGVCAQLGEKWEREWFRKLDDTTALEILRAGTLRSGLSATRPQLRNFLAAIRDYPPGSYFNLPEDRLVKLYKVWFELCYNRGD